MSRRLRDIARDIGFSPPEEEAPFDPGPKLSAVPKPSVVLRSQADEQKEILKGFRNFTQKLGRTGKKHLTIIQSSPGAGKDTVVMPELNRAWADGVRKIALYAYSFRDAKRKVHEFHTKHGATTPVKLHCSPISLELEGAKCTQPQRLSRFADYGFGASRGCKDCPDFAGCSVKEGTLSFDPFDTAEQLGHMPMAIQPRLFKTRFAAEHDGAIIDEHFDLIGTNETTPDQLERFAKACLRYRKPWPQPLWSGEESKGPWPEFSDWLFKIKDMCLALPEKHQFLPNWEALEELDAPLPWAQPMGAKALAWPSWVTESAQAARSGALVTIRDQKLVHAWRTLDGLPDTVLWTNATAWVFQDLIDHWAEQQEVEVSWVGSQLTYSAEFRWVQWRHANRTGIRPSWLLETKEEAVYMLRRVLLTVLERHAEARETHCRILCITYKAVSEELKSASWVQDLQNATGCTIEFTYYEAAMGTNRWERQIDEVILFGDPNPATPGLDSLSALLYGNKLETLRRRMSEHYLGQSWNRPRAKVVTEERANELAEIGVTAVTTFRPGVFPENTIDLLTEHPEDFARLREFEPSRRRDILDILCTQCGVHSVSLVSALIEIRDRVFSPDYNQSHWHIFTETSIKGVCSPHLNSASSRYELLGAQCPAALESPNWLGSVIVECVEAQKGLSKSRSKDSWRRSLKEVEVPEEWTSVKLHRGRAYSSSQAQADLVWSVVRFIKQVLGGFSGCAMPQQERADFWLTLEREGWDTAWSKHFRY